MFEYWVVFSAMSFVAFEAFFAYQDGFFWPSQVVKKFGRAGIGFANHAGAWIDWFGLPFLFAYIIRRHGNWTTKQMIWAGAIGAVVALGNHLSLITTQNVPDIFGCIEEKWSPTIALHFVYTTYAVAVFVLFYFFSPDVRPAEVFIVSVLIGVHCMLGTHLLTGILNLWFRWPGFPQFFSSHTLPPVPFVIWLVLTISAAYAGGGTIGLLVAGVGGLSAAIAEIAMYAAPLM